MRQPLEFRIIGLAVGSALLLGLFSFVRTLHRDQARPLEVTAARRIVQFCGLRPECKVRMGQLFDGDWDTLHTFAPGATQSIIDAALAPATVRAPGQGLLLVLTRHGRIVAQEYDPATPDHPLPSQLQFLDLNRAPRTAGRFAPDTWLWANHHPTDPANPDSDPYYVLTPDDR